MAGFGSDTGRALDPEDSVHELRAFAAALQAELYAKTLHIEKLKAQLATLRRALRPVVREARSADRSARADHRRSGGGRGRQRSGLTAAAITRVYTLPLAAEMLGEDAELLWEVYVDMEPEDGCLWVYGPDDQQIPAFTDFGLECVTDFIREHNANRGRGQNDGR